MYTSFIYDNFKIKIQIKRFNYILLINNLIKKITHKLKLTKKKKIIIIVKITLPLCH